jgi:hypothetical protein
MKVRVRMYRQGLGDCFLVTFDPGGNARHVLIDCGSLGATTTGVKLSEVVADIRDTTKGHIDLVVATHEHIDHLAAFGTEHDSFAAMTVDRVWLAWTEDPKDELARSLAKTRSDLGQALAVAAKALGAAAAADSRWVGDSVRDLLGFSEPSEDFGAPSFAKGLNDSMEFVRTGLRGAKTEYLVPGDQPDTSGWLAGFRFYVLGPPRSAAALSDTGAHGSSELYGMATALRAGAAPLAGLPGVDEATAEREMPFDARLRVPLDHPSSRRWYGAGYFDGASGWRRIDQDWMHVSADLALQLDNLTNNTSLVLAIERIADGKVLLFPADAQQGNWLSWQDPKLSWKVDGPDGKPRTVITNDLLGRTVFYKVGHHSSHNATARAQGLERMEQVNELTAFIPVDRAVALTRNPPGSWQMPARQLYRRLLEKCQGRVARSDLGWAVEASKSTNPKVEKEFVGMATAAEWVEWGKAQKAATHVTVDDKHIDFELR